jgi:hypothetical protein
MNITLSFGPLNEQIMKFETTRNQDSKIQEARQKESFENRKALIV